MVKNYESGPIKYTSLFGKIWKTENMDINLYNYICWNHQNISPRTKFEMYRYEVGIHKPAKKPQLSDLIYKR